MFTQPISIEEVQMNEVSDDALEVSGGSYIGYYPNTQVSQCLKCE